MYHLRLKGEHYQMGVKRGTIFQKSNISFPLHLDTFQLNHGKESEKILREFFPEVCEEIRGVSEIIGADYLSFISWMLCMGCCMYNLENNIPVEIRGCTAFAYSKNDNIIYGRNNDLPPYLRDGSKSEIYSPQNGNRFNITTSSFINGEEGRLLPYFFPDVFCPGGDPIGEARTNWLKARRAVLRSPLDRIGYGGYLKLASNWPGFIDEIQNVVGEFRQIHENMQGTKSYVAPFKVAILNCWGHQRKWMSNQVHHSIYHRETYSAEGVLECLSGMPFDVEFINFDDVRSGIPKDIGVIINVGDAYTAFSGAENWIDEKVVTAIRKFVDEGGGFIGVGEPTACQHQGRYFQLSDVMGVDREMGFSLSTDKYNTCDPHHFILEDESFTGKIDFGEGT